MDDANIKAMAKTECEGECPVRVAHDVLSGKWTTLIFRELLSGPKRYSNLMRTLEGVSPRMLTLRLKDLENHGIVERRQYETIPVTTDYRLTQLGETVVPVIEAMASFGAQIQSAQTDRR